MPVPPNYGEGWQDDVPIPYTAPELCCLRCGAWADEERFFQVRELDNSTKHVCLPCIEEYVHEREIGYKEYVRRYH